MDEMMAETPEHLSELGNETSDQQEGSIRKGPDNSGKQASPHRAAGSDPEQGTSPGKRGRPRSSQVNTDRAEGDGPAGACGVTICCLLAMSCIHHLHQMALATAELDAAHGCVRFLHQADRQSLLLSSSHDGDHEHGAWDDALSLLSPPGELNMTPRVARSCCLWPLMHSSSCMPLTIHTVS